MEHADLIQLVWDRFDEYPELLHDILKAVVELHIPSGANYCSTCKDHWGTNIKYPCKTIQLIEELLQ